MPFKSRFLPFSSSTTTTQALTYLCGISLFSISFLVFLNSSVSFVITDLIGQKKGVGDVIGTLGFVDELVALVACPAWGLISDRLGVRWVSFIGYAIIGLSLFVFVQAKNVYPQLFLARVFFALGASAAATMVTAILPSLTHEKDARPIGTPTISRLGPDPRLSAAYSVESEVTITPETYTRSLSQERPQDSKEEDSHWLRRPSALAGYVGLFTGCGALVALALFLPLPAKFGDVNGVTPGQAVSYSFYVVGVLSLVVSVFVLMGLRNIRGEEGKGWKAFLGLSEQHLTPADFGISNRGGRVIPYYYLARDAVLSGLQDYRISLGYIGGFVARASTVAISLFVPLYVNTFISNGFCQGSPNDPSPELKRECRTAYILSSILSGVAQLIGLLCAPIFGYLSGRVGRINYPVIVATSSGIIGYIILPHLPSPEVGNVEGRGGSPIILFIMALFGLSQIGAIVCSLGSLGRGVLAVEEQKTARRPPLDAPEIKTPESHPLMYTSFTDDTSSKISLKGSIAGVYSLCGGAGILFLTKVGGVLFDKASHGAPFYMMAAFNAVLLLVSLLIDASNAFSSK